jgi:hypothetical protein
MQVIRKTLLDVIAWDSQAKFIIPKWQRHYAWGDKEVRQMWSDWRTDCAQDQKHFCGVLLFRQTAEAGTCWEIVDGQQRITTFFLFFLALRDLCAQDKIDFSELSGVFTLPGGSECRLVLQEGMNEDREIMNALLAGDVSTVEKELLEQSALYGAYRFFRQRLGELDQSNRLEIPTFVVKILQNLDLVVLTVDESDNTRRIFEALNSRGKQVSADYLVANLITFISDDDEELNALAKSAWDYVSGLFDSDDLDLFLDSFSRRSGQQSVRGSAFDEIKFEVETARKTQSVRLWLRQFRRAAEHFKDILSPEDSNDPSQRLLKELQRLRVSKLNPFLLALLEAFRNTPASEPLLHNLVAAVVRLLVTFERPSYRLERFAEDACDAFHRKDVDPDARLEAVIGLIDGIWIDDATFHKQFMTRALYGPGAHLNRLRYYLEKLEQQINGASGMPFEVHFGSDTTVEHIMPQTLDQDGAWRRALKITDSVRLEAQHRALVHTIGNLTVLLTKDNPAAGNAPYSLKRDFYLHPNATLEKLGLNRRKSRLGNCALNEYFENVATWNFQSIVTRGQYLADMAVQIWNKEPWNRETI